MTVISTLCVLLNRSYFHDEMFQFYRNDFSNMSISKYENKFEQIFKEHNGNLIHKWQHYFEIYEKHLSRFKMYPSLAIMEIGVGKGGSLELWRKYFGPDAWIIGVDVDPACKRFENLETENTQIFIGSQEDRQFLRKLKAEIPTVDILIDDGGHMMNQLRVSFEELYDWVADGGVYLVEDLHTSYWKEYQGGYRKKKSFIEYSKRLVDKLNAWHSRSRSLSVDNFTKTTHSMHFYDSVLVIEKRNRDKPFDVMRGYYY